MQSLSLSLKQEFTEVVQSGALVVIPTDTVYGIGANPWSEGAVARLLGAKGRGETMPPPVLVPDVESIEQLAVFDSEDSRKTALHLARVFWPGPLTLVVKSKKAFGWDMELKAGTVALRMPAHPVTLELLAHSGPLAVTSANRTGQPPANAIGEARASFGDEVALYIDGGPSAIGIPSTIIDATGDPWHVLRAGALSLDQLRGALHA